MNDEEYKTAVQRLRELIEKEVTENGLEYMHITLDRKGKDPELIAQEILDILEADKKGLCKPWSDY